MSELDLSTNPDGITSVKLPSGEVVPIDKLISPSALHRSLTQQAQKFEPARKLYEAVQDPEGRTELATQLFQHMAANDPTTLQAIAGEVGFGQPALPAGGREEESSSGGFDMGQLAQVIQAEIQRNVAPFQQQLAQTLAKQQLDSELASLRKTFPGLTPEKEKAILELAAKGTQPGALGLGDFAKLAHADEKDQRIAELQKKLAERETEDLFPALFGKPEASEPVDQSHKWGDKSSDKNLFSDVLSEAMQKAASGTLEVPGPPPGQ